MEEMTNQKLFLHMDQTIAGELFEQTTYPWEILPLIKDFILEAGPKLPKEEYDQVEEDIWIAKSAAIAKTATICGPAIIGPDTEVRPGAFIRGNALIGAGCVVGNSTEIKNDILFNCVQVPHYNYVGDSILGYKSHMGAGSITSNVKSDKTNVVIKNGDEKIETGRKKNRSNPWRLCRSWMRNHFKSWLCCRKTHQYISAFYGERIYQAGKYL